MADFSFLRYNEIITFKGDDFMTNEEVFLRAREEFTLRGLSSNTVKEYIGALRLFSVAST